LPEIHVSPNEGKLLYLLAKLTGAKRVLEIGLLGGYSTIWLARAIAPKGKLVTLERMRNTSVSPVKIWNAQACGHWWRFDRAMRG